jgi:plastocyanin
MRKFLSITAVGLALAVLPSLTMTQAAEAAQYTVTINKMKFGPAPPNLHVGDVIVWQNEDIFEHTATARDKSFDIDLPAHSKKTFTLTKAGKIAFYCRFHPGMTGTLVVSPKQAFKGLFIRPPGSAG